MATKKLVIFGALLFSFSINLFAQDSLELCEEDSICTERYLEDHKFEFGFGPLFNISILEFGLHLDLQYRFQQHFSVSTSFGLFPYPNDIFEYYVTAKVNAHISKRKKSEFLASTGYSYLHWLNFASYPNWQPEGFHNLLLGLEYKRKWKQRTVHFGYQYLSHFQEHIVVAKVVVPVFRPQK